jgi:RNA polymerase sigma-B factor
MLRTDVPDERLADTSAAICADHTDTTDKTVAVHEAQARQPRHGADMRDPEVLLKAIRGFDPGRGTMFSSYARPTIMGELRRHFRDATRPVHVPRDLQELALRAERAARELTERSGNPPTTDALLRHVTSRERDALRLRFEQDLTQREIGCRIGVSQMHVSRVLQGALTRLHDAFAAPAQP